MVSDPDYIRVSYGEPHAARGRQMLAAHPELRSLAMRLAGEAIDEREPEGARISDETLLVLLNAYHQALTFVLPESGGERGCQWELLMDTVHAAPPAPSTSTNVATRIFKKRKQ